MHEERLADSVNAEPIVFMDCTGSEIVMSALISFVVGVPLGFFAGLLFGYLMAGLVIGLLLGLGSTYLVLNFISAVRNKYYETWIKEKFFMMKLRSGMFGLDLIEESTRYGRGARKRE